MLGAPIRSLLGRGEPVIGQLIGLIDDDLVQAQPVDLESQGVAAAKDPGLELILAVIYPPPAFYPEKLGMQRVAVKQHGVGLKACRFDMKTHEPPLSNRPSS